jgi:hypothetical protein
MAVARFLAREFGLAGTTNVEAALMDAAVDAISDATEKQYAAFFFEKVEYTMVLTGGAGGKEGGTARCF